ncbi:MAG: hypothetical protein IPP73_05065 [Chitinophagaceae bacterium]|nr:hypothetical protein [Chitinophagaceae bacterium]
MNWGTKSVFNATDKRLDGDLSLVNFNKQLNRVLYAAENSEIIYAVNNSGAYALSDNIAVSGGIAWAVATLMHPEMLDNPVIPVSYDEVLKFSNKLMENMDALKPEFLALNFNVPAEKANVLKETARVHGVFDQKSLMSGTGLL